MFGVPLTSKRYETTGMSPAQAALGICFVCPHIDMVLVKCVELGQLEPVIALAGILLHSHYFRQFASLAMSVDTIGNPSKCMI